MKKIILALTLLTAAVFASCSNDDTPTDALTGTTWASSYEGIPLEVSFEKGGKATLNMGSERYVGTYTYNQPNVTIQMPIEGQNVTFNGTYSNGALHISNSEYGSFIFTQTGGPSPDDNSENSDGPSLGHTGKLIKKISEIYEVSEDTYYSSINFEYDAQNRPTRITVTGDGLWYYTITYNGNTITVVDSHAPKHIYTATLNAEGYIIADSYNSDSHKKAQGTYTYDDNGMLQSAHIIEEEYDDGEKYSFEEKITYTWSNGNLTTATSVHNHADEDGEKSGCTYSYTYSYDTSVELGLSNLDLGYTFAEILPEPIGRQLGIVGFYGNPSKNPVIKTTATEDNGPYTNTFTSYEYNADGTVRSVYDVGERCKFEFEYYE